MTSENQTMQPMEKRAALSVSGIFATRMLGLFMIFPVFAIFAQQEFKDVTGTQIGIAMGIYGLTQAFLQIPYGVLSDRFGRKPLIIAGMLVFMFGSIICAMADSIEMMIVGRAIQGMGAVAAVLMATVADLVTEQFRLRAMSIVGMTIGFSFTLSLIIGPILGELFGVRGIFWVIALLALAGIFLVIFAVPKIEHQTFQREAEVDPSQFKDVLKNTQLLRLDMGVFVLHSILTAMFVVVPLMIRDTAHLDSMHDWELYLPVMLLSFVLMVPFIIMAESKGKMKEIFVGSILTIGLVQVALLSFSGGYWPIFLILMVFFTAFNLLEASLPSLVVKLSPADKKGTASGVFSSSQFFGAALGGFVGGWMYQHHGIEGVFLFTSAIALLWAAVAATMQKPLPLSIASVPIQGIVTQGDVPALTQQLLSYDGVHEVVFVLSENRVFFKIDRKKIDEVGLINYLERGLS